MVCPRGGGIFSLYLGFRKKTGSMYMGHYHIFFLLQGWCPILPRGGGGGQLTGALHEPYGKLAPETTSLFEVGLPQRQIKTPFKPRFACSSAVRGQLYSHKCEILGFCRTRPVWNKLEHCSGSFVYQRWVKIQLFGVLALWSNHSRTNCPRKYVFYI